MRLDDQVDLHVQIAAGLGESALWLRFPSALEERFERDRRSNRGRHLSTGVLIALVIYDLFLLCDYWFLREHFLRCLILRLAIVTPLTYGMYCWLQLDPPRRLRESMTLVVSCIVGFTTLYLWHGVSAVATAFAQMALVLLILFVNTIMRLRFLYALASTAFCIVDGALFLRQDRWLAGPEKSTCLCLVMAGAVFTLVANYWMEREERLSYLLHLQVEIHGAELSAANRELSRLSNLDALTSLANRRYFSMSFSKAWEHAAAALEPLSLLLIDIDRFKRINDEYGHLYGDETLVHLGRVLREGLRNEEAVAARYGGEEFVVLLPGLPLDDALAVAERLRELTRTIEIPSQQGLRPAQTTVSIGVASVQPKNHPKNQHCCDELLHNADLALYQAKMHGRDRVWPAVKTTPAEEPLGTPGRVADPQTGLALYTTGTLIAQ